MIDYYILATPLLLFGVMALVGFVGCNQFFDIEETQPIPPPEPPINLSAMPGDKEVLLDWFVAPDATQFHLFRATMTGNVIADYPLQRLVHPNEVPYPDPDVVNGTQYFYRVTAVNSAGESDLSDEAIATPRLPYGAFVKTVTGGLVRTANPSGSFYGMAFQIGADPLKAGALGRAVDLGFVQPHSVYLVDGNANGVLASVTLDMNSDVEGNFRFKRLSPTIDLVPGRTYYVLSQEFAAPADEFLDDTAVVTTRAEASVLGAVKTDSPPVYIRTGGVNNSFGPVNIWY
ncbi:MAG TPA: hypothetical protein VM099_03740 [Gemmatimonadaceae bacterium]|nr:hypothetical protein [Gemmatimonadaceae bacterium]